MGIMFHPDMHRALHVLLISWVAMSILLSIGALVTLYPFHPSTLAGSLVWFTLTLPISVALEYISGRVFSRRVSASIDPDNTHVSSGRMIYALVSALFLFTLIALISGLAKDIFGEFIEANYSDRW
jgi:hypothetical protein